MSEAKVGARVAYCGHEGWFIADIHLVEGANVVRANGKVDGGTINRNMEEATHHLSDFPKAGYWNPGIGVFVVPANQVTVIDRTPRLVKQKVKRTKK